MRRLANLNEVQLIIREIELGRRDSDQLQGLWLTAEDSSKLVGKTVQTLRSWRRQNLTRSGMVGQKRCYPVRGLLRAQEQAAAAYAGRSFKAGPGAGKKGYLLRSDEPTLFE